MKHAWGSPRLSGALLCLALAACFPAQAAGVGTFTCAEGGRQVAADGTVSMSCELSVTVGISPISSTRSQDFKISWTPCEKGFVVWDTEEDGSDSFRYTVTETDNEIRLHSLPVCHTIRFDDIASTEEGVSFCPKILACSLVGDLDCRSVQAPQACAALDSCAACAAAEGCGWCYSSDGCLPAATAAAVVADRCGQCADFTLTCSACLDDCGDRGVCSGGVCVCEEGWYTDAAPCDVYRPPPPTPPTLATQGPSQGDATGAPPAGLCAHAVHRTAVSTLRALKAGVYHDAVRLPEEPVVRLAVYGAAAAAGRVFLRAGREVALAADDGAGGLPGFDVSYDTGDATIGGAWPQAGVVSIMRAGDGAAGGCHEPLPSDEALSTLLFVAEMPLLGRWDDLWVASTEPETRLRLVLTTCAHGEYYGPACGVPAFKRGERPLKPGGSLRPSVLMVPGTSYYFPFTVLPGVRRLSASVTGVTGDGGLPPLPARLAYYLKGGEVVPAGGEGAAIPWPLPGDDWGVMVTLPPDSAGAGAGGRARSASAQQAPGSGGAPRVANVTVAVEAEGCTAAAAAAEEAGCGGGVLLDAAAGFALPETTLAGKDLAFDADRWVVASFPVMRGTDVLSVSVEAKLPSLRLYVRKGARPTVRPGVKRRVVVGDGAAAARGDPLEQYSSGDATIRLSSPDDGLWYVGVHSEAPVDAASAAATVSLRVEARACGAACRADEACAPGDLVRYAQCDADGCTRAGSVYTLWSCARGTAAPHVPHVFVGVPEEEKESVFTTARVLTVVGLTAVVLVLCVPAVVYSVSYCSVQRERKRRLGGGYDSAAPPPDTVEPDDAAYPDCDRIEEMIPGEQE